ncbi:unnamed protein product [Arabis nemorensis]|uniref:Uncharacterized protein n=1 Tax=Arabis nemorensis TaxID=586526 RepID=A0A565B175_9BRAS|nr:unnamed protein product [Arabis nemorensis]
MYRKWNINSMRTRGLEGHNGTWEQFLKVYDPEYGHLFPCPSFRGPSASIAFLTTLSKKEDVQLLMAWLTSPSRVLRHHYSKKLSHEYYLSPHNNPEDWLVTGTGSNKYKTEMISLCCDMVLCEDGIGTPIRVVAADRDFKVLTVLKMDHARAIDTSPVFTYDYSGSPTLEKPSLNDLCTCILGYDMSSQSNSVYSCLNDVVVAMKLVLAVVEKGAETSIPPTEEMLKDASSKGQKSEHGSAVVNQCRDGEEHFKRGKSILKIAVRQKSRQSQGTHVQVKQKLMFLIPRKTIFG